MSTERIKQLHEQASECYLNGDYKGALAAWRDVLGLDPSDEQALGGVRLASQFVEPEAPVVAAASPDIDNELDRGLKILDGLGAPELLQADPADGSVDRQAAPQEVGETPVEEPPEGWETSPAASPDEGSFGLDPVERSSPTQTAPASAAAAELKRRVEDLLTEAKAKAEAGERDDALAILSRLAILDEENAEAEALRAKIEAAGASDLDKVERAIIEGVAALEADRLDDAERFFKEALAIAPAHREAQHYLEKVAERRESGHADLLAKPVGESAPVDDAVNVAIATATAAGKATPASAQKSQRPAAAPPETPAAKPFSIPRFALPSPKVLILGGVAAVVVVCAAIAVPRFLGGSAPKAPAPKASAPGPRGPRAGKAAPAGKAPAHAAPANPEERAKAVAASLAAGQSRLAAGDFGGAVIAFNDVLTLDPTNAEAKTGLTEAGDRYKSLKAERDAIDNVTLAFRDGEFASGLRLAYRLPPSVNASYVDAIKVTGWYNLAVIALRAGDCRGAQGHLEEALQIAPSDAEAKKLREFAARYADAVRDRSFLDRVEALSFRPFPAP